MSIQLSDELQKLTKSERGTTSSGHRPQFNIIIVLTTEVEPFPLLCMDMYIYIYIKGICQSDLQAVFRVVKKLFQSSNWKNPGVVQSRMMDISAGIQYKLESQRISYIDEVNLTARASR